MRTRLLIALGCAAILLFFGSREVFWGDYAVEAWPAYFGLRTDGIHQFLKLMPAYSGFVSLIGAPVALLNLGMDWTFRLNAIPGLLVLVGLAGALHSRERAHTLLAIVLVAASPVAYFALWYGHPEDVLAAGAATAGVLAAVRQRATLSAVLLTVAVLAKQTAVLALLPAALALPKPKLRVLAAPVIAALAAYGGLMLLRPGGVGHTGISGGSFFHPWQVWWPLGVPSDPAWADQGHGEITSPAWLAPIPHPLIVALALPLSLLWWWRRGSDRPREDALALFALLALERCLLDPWNLGYYHLPLVLALVAWETEKRRPPVIALATTGALWLTFKSFEMREGMAPMLMYLAWTLPLGAMLIRELYAKPARVRKLAPAYA